MDHIEEHKVADLKTVPVEQHQPMLQAIAKESNDLIAIGTFANIEVPKNRKAISSRIVLKVKHRADGAFLTSTRLDLSLEVSCRSSESTSLVPLAQWRR